jgi:hypothetical protein
VDVLVGTSSPFSVPADGGAGAEIGGRAQRVQAAVGQFVCVDIAADPAGFCRLTF